MFKGLSLTAVIILVVIICLPKVAGATIHQITIGDNFFSPLGTMANPGDTVRWVWAGGFPHSTTSDVTSPKTWSSATTGVGGTKFDLIILPTDPQGAWPYHCAVHFLTMKDTIWVSGTCYPDADADGFGDGNSPVNDADGVCAFGFTDNGLDCDDASQLINPGEAEITCDGIDNDCNAGTPDEIDADADGVSACTDCNDADPEIGICSTCCGQFTGGFAGNTDCDPLGKRNLADITRLIDRVYISKATLCCEENGNVNGDVDGKLNLADITLLIDHVYISKGPTAACL